MGGLRTHMPVTFRTMLIGALAIAGIPPLAGFFSKDEILYRTFLGGSLPHGLALVLWIAAVATACLTAFYMFRLMLLTFFGTYRGRAWDVQASPAAALEAAVHGARHPLDAHAHGQAQRAEHEVSHGAADVLTHTDVWHGPHEAPGAMTAPLIVLAAGAVVAGFIGVPAALGGSNRIEHFLAPAFAARGLAPVAHEEPHLSAGAEIGLMLLSIAVAAAGILLARYIYAARTGLADTLASRWHRLHSLLVNKYYVDEIYDRMVVRATMSGAMGFWRFDARVVDGAVNAWAWSTQIAAWFSHMFDKYVVDGIVNLVGWSAGEGSYAFRRVQTGLVQNYALMILAGVFVLLTVYLLAG